VSEPAAPPVSEPPASLARGTVRIDEEYPDQHYPDDDLAEVAANPPRTAWLAPEAFDDQPSNEPGHRPSPGPGPDASAAASQAPSPEPPRPRPGPWRPPEPSAQYPIPPAFTDLSASRPAPVPTWSFRAPTPPEPPAAERAAPSDLALDPLSLRPRCTIRSGASAMTVHETGLSLRKWLRRSAIPWSDVRGFEARLGVGRGGQLVMHTADGPVELPATRRPAAELEYLHALLDAYQRRAQLMANR
jgi:hypothetical protein